MYQLYYYPLNASMAPHFMLEELKVDFELIIVDRKSNAQKSSDYLVLNPAGRIPTLIDSGFAIFESPAICVHCNYSALNTKFPKKYIHET
ncbi:glutathione S-transferase N-terminal domain-containing protein, partial [Microbulbifer sp. OS29]|nr:glutathione S-transferase N-terminal domain-containing protein [Microbulbifer okhotskensis]